MRRRRWKKTNYKKKNNIKNDFSLLYCLFLFSLSFSSQMIMHYTACWRFMSQNEWLVYTQKGVFKWLILHFYSISFWFASKYTKFGTFYYVSFILLGLPCLCALAHSHTAIRLWVSWAATAYKMPSVCYSCMV